MGVFYPHLIQTPSLRNNISHAVAPNSLQIVKLTFLFTQKYFWKHSTLPPNELRIRRPVLIQLARSDNFGFAVIFQMPMINSTNSKVCATTSTTFNLYISHTLRNVKAVSEPSTFLLYQVPKYSRPFLKILRVRLLSGYRTLLRNLPSNTRPLSKDLLHFPARDAQYLCNINPPLSTMIITDIHLPRCAIHNSLGFHRARNCPKSVPSMPSGKCLRELQNLPQEQEQGQ